MIIGTFETFGAGCPGSVPAPSFCLTKNPNGGTLSGANNDLEYAYTVLNTRHDPGRRLRRPDGEQHVARYHRRVHLLAGRRPAEPDPDRQPRR